MARGRGSALLGAAGVIALLCTSARATFIGAAVIPHGDFALDPSLVHNANGSLEIHKAAFAVAKSIEKMAPDIIFMTTPHGLEFTENFALYQNTNSSGFALIGTDLHNASFRPYKVPLKASLSPLLSMQLLQLLNKTNAKVEGLLAFADSEDIPLRWGEVVPLWFMSDFLEHLQVIVLSMPTRRYTMDRWMVPELQSLGALLFDFFDSIEETVMVVISSDLAHTHLASGPYGYSPSAKPFDIACGAWAQTLAPEPLLDTARGLVDEALSCGYTGLVLLHGLLERGGGTSMWAPQLLANYHPTYYGMMVAQFTAREQPEL